MAKQQESAGTDAQQNNGFVITTKTTRKPGKVRKAATTPRAQWVQVADTCPDCDSTFDMCAPERVIDRMHRVWQIKHSCEA